MHLTFTLPQESYSVGATGSFPTPPPAPTRSQRQLQLHPNGAAGAQEGSPGQRGLRLSSLRAGPGRAACERQDSEAWDECASRISRGPAAPSAPHCSNFPRTRGDRISSLPDISPSSAEQRSRPRRGGLPPRRGGAERTPAAREPAATPRPSVGSQEELSGSPLP